MIEAVEKEEIILLENLRSVGNQLSIKKCGSDCDSKMHVALRRVLVSWRTFVVLLSPLVLLPLVFTEPQRELRCAYVVILMSVFWMTEALPLPITSLLPVVLFPLLGVLGTSQVCVEYLKESNMMFIGGLMMAIAIEHCNLHKRIALRAILLFGTSPRRILVGFMATTMFLSMWISNSATTAMMAPIAVAVCNELKNTRDVDQKDGLRSGSQLNDSNNKQHEQTSVAVIEEGRRKSEKLAIRPRPDKETVGYFLGIAYSSDLGGAGTLTGTGTNLTFKGIFDSIFPGAEGVNFASWMIFGVPLMLLNVTAACLWLQFRYMRLFRRKKKTDPELKNQDRSNQVEALMRKNYNDLGPITFHEASVLVLFVVLVLLWFFREPEFIPGWGNLISNVPIKDATPVMLVVCLMFVLPVNLDFFRCDAKDRKPTKSLLNWKVINDKLPWGLVLLLGGGFAMAAASDASGLSVLLGNGLVGLQVLPPVVIMMIISTATTAFTVVSSNVAVANIMLPVLAEMACAMRIHPLYFMIPATLSCSYAFMLPVSTPPNAIVLAASNMKTPDMMKSGLGLNIICLIILFIMFPTFGSYVFNLDEFPDYAWQHVNDTSKMTL